MKDALSMIIAVILLVILIIILPLYNYFERQDDMSYNVALKTVTMFVDEVAQNGYLDQNMYDKFIERLASTGNSYDIEVEAQKKVMTIDPDNASADEGEETYVEQYKSYYNKDIFNDETGQTSTVISKDNTLKNSAFFFDVGDRFNVRIKNTNTTMASALLSAIVSTVPKEKINISYGATIKNNNWENTTVSQLYQSDILITIKLENPNDAGENTGFPEYNFQIAQDRILEFKVKVLNHDDSNIPSKLTENVRLVGTNPNCYISPSSISEGTDEGEYILKFVLDESKFDNYFGSQEYNVFECFLPSNCIQGNFSKNASVSSQKIVIKINNAITVPEI
ncbi:MAG: hypothetical protein J6A15_04940 [Clostridia bacterium]|nr:hypothetical protein [Clostridia bacterium]